MPIGKGQGCSFPIYYIEIVAAPRILGM